MPPKRRRPVAGNDLSQSEDLPRTGRAAIASRLTPLQAKQSTSYGSPAPVMPLRDSTGHGANLRGAARNLFATVRKDNEKAELAATPDRELSEGAVRRSSRLSATPQRQSTREPSRLRVHHEVSEEEEDEDDEEEEYDDYDDDNSPEKQLAAAGRSESPQDDEEERQQSSREDSSREGTPVVTLGSPDLGQSPEQQGRSEPQRAGREATPPSPARDNDAGSPGPTKSDVLGKRPVSEDAPSSPPKRPKVSHAPLESVEEATHGHGHSESLDPLSLTARSFIEESHVFREAELRTPAASSSVMGDTPSRRDPPISQAMRATRALGNSRPLQPQPTSQQLNNRALLSTLSRPQDKALSHGFEGVEKEDEEERDYEPAPRVDNPRGPSTAGRPEMSGAQAEPPRSMPPPQQRGAWQRQASNPAFTSRPGPHNAFTSPPPKPPPARPTDDEQVESHTAASSALSRQQLPGARLARPVEAAAQTSSTSDQPPPAPLSDGDRDRRQASEDGSGSGSEDDEGTAQQAPWQHLVATKKASHKLLRPAATALRWFSYLVLALFLLRFWQRTGNPELESAKFRIHPTIEWYGWTDWSHNLGQFVPYTLRHPLGCISDDEYNVLKSFVNSNADGLEALGSASKATSTAIETLQEILPRVVSVKKDKRTSRLVISQDFWHALKDLIQQEKTILTLQPGKGGAADVSEPHWQALLRRFKEHGVPGPKPLGTGDVEAIVERAVPSSWERWVKSNGKRAADILGTSSFQAQPSMAEKDILSHADQLISEKLTAKGLRDVVVTRDEFVKEVEKSLVAYKTEVQAEIETIRSSLQGLVDAATKASKSPPAGGMTRSEIIELTNGIVRKAIGDAQLGAAAKGNIGTNFEAELSRRVNYFALGNGALIDSSLTSPTYERQRPASGGGALLSWLVGPKSAPASAFRAEKFAALTSWEDAGQCWCAANRFRDEVTHPADISIKLPQSVVPENVVVEHIDPAATLDPDAMPREVEIWAIVDEDSRRKIAYDFMMTTFPDTHPDHPLIRRGFLKMGAFTYEHSAAAGGVQVYQLSPEYAKMDVTTDHVLVRAVTNYGADHTCFYRVRFYGEPRELTTE